MKEKLREFLRPRLAVLLAAALLAAYLPAMPAARADGVAPTSAWEEQDGVRDEHFVETPTTLDSYTYSKSDGTTETVTVNSEAELGSKLNPISIPDEEELILFGNQMNNATSRKYYILDKQNGVYDMRARTMRSLMGDVPEETGMPDPGGPFQGVLIGNGARIENVYINIDGESDAFGLFGTIGGAEIADLTVSLPSASAGSSANCAGGLVGHVQGDAVLTNCTAEVACSLTADHYAGGLVGYVQGNAALTNCTAEVAGDLTADNAGGLVGKVRDGTATLKDCTANVTGDLDGQYAGGLVGYVFDGATLTNCTANVTGNVTGNLTAGGSGNAGGLVGRVQGDAALTNCTAEVVGSLTAGESGYAGGLVGFVLNGATLKDCTTEVAGSLTAGERGNAGGLVGVSYGTATLTDCTAEVAGSLTAGSGGYAGGLVGVGTSMTLTNCTATVTGSLTAGNAGYAGGLVGLADPLSVTLTDCAAQAVITKQGDGSYAPSGPVRAGATFSGANVTTLRMGAGSSVYLALVNGTTLALTEAGVLKAAGYAASNGITGSVEVTSDGGAEIRVHGGSDPDGRTYTLTGVNGTLRLEDKSPAEYWVTADASFGTSDADPLAKGDVVDLLGAADNRLFTVAVEAGTGGSVSVTNGGPVSAGTTVTVEATPNSGYRFVGWTEDGQQVSTEARYTFPVARSCTLTAVFAPQCTVTVQAGTGGSATGGGTFDAGASVTVTANPVSGYRFVGWTENGQQVSTEARYTFPVARSCTLTAVFAPQCTVTVQAGTGGSVTGGGTFDEGTEITVKATPESGYRFVNWTEDGQQVSTKASYTFEVTASRTLTAVFERTSSGGSSGGGGTYTPPPKKDEPQTGSSGGWKDIQKELEDTKPGDTVDVTMNGATEVPKEVLEDIAGKDVEVSFDMGGGIVWTVNGKDIPAGIGSLNLGIKTGSSSIPVNVVNAITGEKSTMQFTLAHSGPFGTVLHLSLNLGATNRGYWANLYWFDEGGKELVFQHSCRIDEEGTASWPFDHASSYAVVIDEKNHDPAWENPFTDVSEGDWYYEAVRFVHEQGLMNGYSDGRFGPNDTLSRAQLAQILFNKEGRPVVNYLMQFDDVAGEAWYTEAVRWAASQGIVGGYGNGTFGPNDPITREQLAVMLWRYSGSPAATSKELYFNDTDEISGFALEALRWAVENGILNGYGDGRLGPQGQATRAQVAQMLKNFIENQEEENT